MPLYVYRCDRCKAEVELQRKISEMDFPVSCLACTEEGALLTDRPGDARVLMARVISAPAGHFPGASSWRG